MILCLDVGNSQIFGGVFDNHDELQLRFRYATVHGGTSDQLGIFLKGVIEHNDFEASDIENIAICSVVPSIDYSLRAACLKYFSIDPFILQAGVKTGLKIKYRNPVEVGADRIANAIAASHYFPDKNLIVVDFGTATTFCVISKNKDYQGGAILPGIRLSMEALQIHTEKLSSVEILRPQQAIGRSTTEGIQAGLYYSQLGVVKEMAQRIHQETFNDEEALLIGTGGFGHLFEAEQLFDKVMPELVLDGLRLALLNNR